MYSWTYRGRTFAIAHDENGRGLPVLLLPALSTVSTREEWRAVATALGREYAVVLVDWPGFGASSRPPADYSPALLHAFLRDFVQWKFGGAPVAVAAAGHAAGYVLRLAAEGDASWAHVVLAAPTWRGPLPTAMGRHPALFRLLRSLVRAPAVGPALYRFNTSARFLRYMLRRHVIADPAGLTQRYLAGKQQVARQPGARFAAAAFVTGALDPFPDRAGCLAALRRVAKPRLMVIGDRTPPRSRAEMDAMRDAAGLPALTVRGALGLHEECAGVLGDALRTFLGSAV